MTRPVHGGNLAWAAGLAGCNPNELIDFSASISPLGPPLSVREAVRADFLSVMAYPDPAYGELRGAIARHHHMDPSFILPGNGAAELLNWAARDLAGLSRCFCLSPGFSDYNRALQAFDAQLTPVALFNKAGEYNNDWEALLESNLDNCGLLLNNPHNPTGALFSKERVRSLLSKFALVVVDEAFMDFLPADYEQSVIDWVSESANLVVIRSLTKFYSMPGLRLGYAIAHPNRLARWQQWRDAWPVNTLAATAGIAALKDGSFQQKTWQWLSSENDFLYQRLQTFPQLKPLPSCVNFFLVRSAVSATDLQVQLLQQYRIYIRDCVSFSELGDRYFRVAVKSREDNQRLLTALADVLPTMTEVGCAS
ncbi:MAG: threonine-phosphate decarboxylase CobD [Cyanobacteria bacterium J06621_3]